MLHGDPHEFSLFSGHVLDSAPHWVLRTAIGPAILTEQLAVRSTGAQH